MSGITTLYARDAASDAAKAAAYKATVELWTLYSFGVAVTLLRTHARVRAVGFRNLKADDYLIWVAIDGLSRRYRIPVYIGFALVGGSMIASVLTIFTACRPFNHYWQINPAPENVCQPAISMPIIWVTFAANLATDPYLIFIPIPMLWKSSLKLLKKIAVTIVLSAGVFVLVCATIKSVFLIVDPVSGAQTAEEWGTRETFVAVITTNLPMIFHLFKSWLGAIFGSAFQSTQKIYKTPSGGFRSIGGGDYQSRDRRGPTSSNPVTANMTFNESEERIVDNVHLEGLKAYAGPVGENTSSNGIVVSSQIEVTHEAIRSANSVPMPEQNVHEPW
ncbi:hypothetical protein PENSUB_9555 [Penicillium subrubescens]|uniref:Rhodopsin domain-containing protein n=1 Tax=Penicillium subrubescens TaxID=1316194 RepID=A0A1Q5TCN9_9EURO|nr:hypothetical protein PENSUB_9555 [Penicillium subrubescens]